MTRIASVKTVNSNKALWFDASDLEIKVGQNVVVETSRGTEFGTMVKEIFEASDKEVEELKSELKPVLRIANEKDEKRFIEMEKRAQDAYPIFRELAAETNADMIPISVEYLLDGRKAIFYFSAPERQDFRDLVKKLSSKFKLRVDMRQINEREKSALVGGIGICGQELCCARIGRCPKHVSIKQAKTQGLSLNPESVSGMCGKLLCCLDYEFPEYEDFTKRAPKQKSKVLTPDGEAVVTDINMPKETIEIKLQDSEKTLSIPLSDFKIDKKFARQNGIEDSDIRPNYIGKSAWERANRDTTFLSFESLYTSTNLLGSEKLSTGTVTTLPGSKRRTSKTKVADESSNKKSVKSSSNKKMHPRKNRNRNVSNNTNVYEKDSSTTVRRRSRTLDSGAVRPGQNSSGLRKK